MRVVRGCALLKNSTNPQGLGAEVTPENMRKLERLKKRLRQEELERMGMLRELAARLNSVSLTIQAKVSQEGHLFGSVTSNMVYDALVKEGVELDPKAVRLEENIKEVGVYAVPIHLHPEIQAKVRVWVVEEREGQEGATMPEAEDAGGKEAEE